MKIYVLLILLVFLFLTIAGMWISVSSEKKEEIQWVKAILYLLLVAAEFVALIFQSLQLH